jgi:hypothetical protein
MVDSVAVTALEMAVKLGADGEATSQTLDRARKFYDFMMGPSGDQGVVDPGREPRATSEEVKAFASEAAASIPPVPSPESVQGGTMPMARKIGP